MDKIIVGDIHGQLGALLKISKLYPNIPIISTGDMIDRGPSSALVLDFMMNNQAVLGNHEHMMLDFLKPRSESIYDFGLWCANGGAQTVESLFDGKPMHSDITKFMVRATQLVHGFGYGNLEWLSEKAPRIKKEIKDKLGKRLEWLQSLPYRIELEECFVQHAPYTGGEDYFGEITAAMLRRGWLNHVLWSVDQPIRDTKLVAYGHVDGGGFKSDDHGIFAVSLDTSRQGKLTALLLPEMELIQVDF